MRAGERPCKSPAPPSQPTMEFAPWNQVVPIQSPGCPADVSAPVCTFHAERCSWQLTTTHACLEASMSGATYCYILCATTGRLAAGIARVRTFMLLLATARCRGVRCEASKTFVDIPDRRSASTMSTSSSAAACTTSKLYRVCLSEEQPVNRAAHDSKTTLREVAAPG